MKRILTLLVAFLLALAMPGTSLPADAESESGTTTVVLDDMEGYADTTALTDAGYTINPWAVSAGATTVTLNKDPANSFSGNSASVKLGDDNRNPSLQNSFNVIEGAEGFEFWFSNPNANAAAIYISFNWGPFIKASTSYFVKDFSKNDETYVERTTVNKQYFNMEFEPGFKGFVRMPFSSCSAPVDSLASTSIQIWSLGETTPGNGNTYYFDNISLYGLPQQEIPTEDRIASIEVTSKPYGFVPRIPGEKYTTVLAANGYNAANELRATHTFVWTLKAEYDGVSLSPAGVLEVDETAALGEIKVLCTVQYTANGELDKSLEFKIDLSVGDRLLTSTGATQTPPGNSSKDYFRN